MTAVAKPAYGTKTALAVSRLSMTCRTCGVPYTHSYFGRGGRIPEYCSAECRDVYKFWNAFVRSIDSVCLSDSKRSEWSARLFLQRNCLGNKKGRVRS